MDTSTNTLILIDKKFLNELNDSFLHALDIYLDKTGKTELIYDFSVLIEKLSGQGRHVSLLSFAEREK